MRNAFPGKNDRSTHCVLLTHVALGMLHFHIYREGVRQYPILFIDNKMMHLQYSAFGGN